MYTRISSAMASFCRNMPLEAAMRMVKDAGFDGVDFPFNAFSTLPDSPMQQENWRDWVREVKRLSENLNLPVVQAHATWEQEIPDGFRYEAPHEIYFRTIEACCMLGCRDLVFHPLRQPNRVDSPKMRGQIHDYNVRWFHDLISTAERCGVVINLENTFDSHHTQKPEDLPYPYTTAEDMVNLMNDIGGNHVKICLDTGHANISAQDIPAMIRLFGRDLATVHLNDNYGRIEPVYEDLHLFPGYGRIDWEPVLDALREVGFRGTLNMEPIGELKRVPNRIRRIQLRAAADTLRALADG